VWVGFRPIRFISACLLEAQSRAKMSAVFVTSRKGWLGRLCGTRCALFEITRIMIRIATQHPPLPSHTRPAISPAVVVCVVRQTPAKQALNLRTRQHIFSPNLRGAAVGVWATRPTQALASHPIFMRVLFKATSASARLRTLTGSRGVVLAPCLCTHASFLVRWGRDHTAFRNTSSCCTCRPSHLSHPRLCTPWVGATHFLYASSDWRTAPHRAVVDTPTRERGGVLSSRTVCCNIYLCEAFTRYFREHTTRDTTTTARSHTSVTRPRSSCYDGGSDLLQCKVLRRRV
jgi:hypothetical protein